MAIHPALIGEQNVHHLKVFSKALEVLETQLSSAGADRLEVSIEGRRRGLFAALIEPVRYKGTDQIMEVRGQAEGCDFEILVSMINTGWLTPLELYFLLPEPVSFHAVCNRSMFGRRWDVDPMSKQTAKRLDAVLPPVNKNHAWVALVAKLRVFYQITGTDDGRTLLFVQTGFKSGMFNQPKFDVRPFIEALPGVRSILQESR